MLTIQPKLTATRPVAFKAEAATITPDEEKYYEQKKDYYRQKIRECDEIIQDGETPEALKKTMKVFKVVSEALLDGWVVAWGATKGSKIVKSTVISTLGSKAATKAKDFVKPLGGKISKWAGAAADAVSNGLTNLKGTKFMSENSFGKILTKGLNALTAGVKFIGDKISKLTGSLKSANIDKAYDKTAKAASVTLGTGAGAAGAYNAATDADKRTEEQEAAPETNVTDTEIDEDEKFPGGEE